MIMQMLRRHGLLFLFIILIAFFTWTRLYKIESTLEFYNDMGRDLLVLYDWQHSGKPPLLGPQMSNMPFNQSAVYFYMLFPLYLLSHGSLLNTIYTCVLFTLSCFGLTYWLATKYDKSLRLPILLFIFLSIIQPQMIIQQRFVWNPSFVLPSLMVAGFSFLMLTKRWNLKLLAISTGAIGLSIALNVSSFPVLIGFWLTTLIIWKKKGLIYVASTIAAVAFWNFPTIVFELSHKFLLVRTILERGITPQEHVGFIDKMIALSNYTFGFGQFSLLVGGIVLVFVMYRAFNLMKYKKQKALRPAFLLFVCSLLATVISPFTIQSHYIFPLLSMFLLVVTALPLRHAAAVTLVLCILWIQPAQIRAYLQAPHRTVAQLEACMQQVCQNEHDPLFVSTQAGFHVFHTGPEFRYLFKKHGCDVRTLELDPNAATTMALVVDNSTYDPNVTAFNELTIFGPSHIAKTFTCDGNMQVLMLQKGTN